MKEKLIDLHVHSNASDGTFSPEELVKLAKEKGLKAFALTDHDTVAGLEEAKNASVKFGVEVIPGIEFSTVYQGQDVHVVGLDIPYENPEFVEALRRFQDSRLIRNQKMIEKMMGHGIEISWEKMTKRFGESVWTRAHFGRYLMEHGYVQEIGEAFQKYIGQDCCCYVSREKVTPMQAVELVSKMGGVPILAHPMLYHFSDGEFHCLVHELKEAGLIGIEALYSKTSLQAERYARKLVRDFGLAVSGGSDFHGANKPGLELGTGYGKLRVTYDVLENLRRRRAENE